MTTKTGRKVTIMTGNQAIAEAMRQINPDVAAVYPITPQTDIAERLSAFVADGLLDTVYVPVESEHSAMSACVGAAAARSQSRHRNLFPGSGLHAGGTVHRFRAAAANSDG